MKTQKDLFAKLKELSGKITTLEAIGAVLSWDQETYMPSGAIEARSEQLALLNGIIHKEKTSSSYKKALSALVDLSTGECQQPHASLEVRAAAREWRRNFIRDAKLPSAFVKKFSLCTSASLHAWDEAKKKNNFSLFKPHLEKIVTLSRKKASLLGYANHPYDALLDLYDPGLTVEKLTPLFAALKEALIILFNKISEKHKTVKNLQGTFPLDLQKKLGTFLLDTMGFNEKTSRLDLSSHPFCIGIHPDDIRMTTRIDPLYPTHGIYSVIHEGGHGLYHQNLPSEYYGTPLCESASCGMDESQSRLWETMIGRGKHFCSFLYPKLKEIFPSNFSSFSEEDFYRFVNKVSPSEIRVEADEVTYSLHIILRFEMEKALMEGSLRVADVPSVWNQKMKEMLGITPSSDRAGCLQDIHWAMGGIGYFPGYTVGNLFAAQIFTTLRKTFPEMNKKIAVGDFSFLRDWLSENIHSFGKIYTPEELIVKATGKPLGSDDYIAYLKEKFEDLVRI